MQGQIKWFSPARNYGFIQTDNGDDIFLHGSGLTPGLAPNEGDKVQFEVEQTSRGLKAIDVEIVN